MATSEFSKWLEKTMVDKNLSQSDVARMIWGEVIDERGYASARNRQQVGKWVRGEVEPRRLTQLKVSRAIGVPLPSSRKSGTNIGDGENREHCSETGQSLKKSMSTPTATVQQPSHTAIAHQDNLIGAAGCIVRINDLDDARAQITVVAPKAVVREMVRMLTPHLI